jgi:hypothetical protein
MPDWTTYKGQTPWEFTKSPVKHQYNEGSSISSDSNAVFSITHVDKPGVPITTLHNPCGYWGSNMSANIVLVKYERASSLTDFTTFTEVDPQEVLSQTTNRATHTHMLTRFDTERYPNHITYLYKDFGVGYFGLNFIHEFAMIYPSNPPYATIDAYTLFIPYSIGNSFYFAVEPEDYTGGMGVMVDFYKPYNEAGLLRINFASNQVPMVAGDITYIRITRNLGEAVIETYSDADMTLLLGSATATIPADEVYRYMYATATTHDGWGGYRSYVTGYIENIKLYGYALIWNGSSAVEIAGNGVYELVSGGKTLTVDVKASLLPYSLIPETITVFNREYTNGVMLLNIK